MPATSFLLQAQTKSVIMNAPIHIESNDFLLHRLTSGDASPHFLSWLNSAEMLSSLNLPALNFTPEQLAQFIASFDNLHNYLHVITLSITHTSPVPYKAGGFSTLTQALKGAQNRSHLCISFCLWASCAKNLGS